MQEVPTPTTADNGKVLGVTNGEYALQEASGGGGTQLYLHVIRTDEDGAYTEWLGVVSQYDQPFTSILDMFDKCSQNDDTIPTAAPVSVYGGIKVGGSRQTYFIISFLNYDNGILVLDSTDNTTKIITRNSLSSEYFAFIDDTVTPL